MSIKQEAGSETVTSVEQLAEYLAQGAKTPGTEKIGVEHEKFPFDLATHRPVPFDGPRGIEAFLSGMTRFGWQEIREDSRLIGLERGAEHISLEPGGQVELSGAQRDTLHEVAGELATHIREANEVASALGFGFLGLGYHPAADRAAIPVMPKARYAIMRGYMPKVGGRGLDMMLRTCTAQVNLDFTGEADMVAKLRVGLKLQPVATALFANSPLADGRPAPHIDERAAVWLDVDPARTGSLPVAFEPGFGFQHFAAHALDVPMYFVVREGRYIDATGASFRDFMAGGLRMLPGERPTLSDWADHITTVFTEVRLKRYIEMRGADVGLPPQILAVAALWTGLLYDPVALDRAGELADSIALDELPGLRLAAARQSLADTRLLSLARAMVPIAEAGLAARRRLDAQGRDETVYLAPLHLAVEIGSSPARHVLDTAKQGLDAVFAANRY